jgi:hypothetical protein
MGRCLNCNSNMFILKNLMIEAKRSINIKLLIERSEANVVISKNQICEAKRTAGILKLYNIEAKRTGSIVILYLKQQQKSELSFFF